MSPAPGMSITPEHREAISRAAQARHRALRESQTPPDRKRCSRCNTWKPLPEGFTYQNRTLVSGEVVRAPTSRCKECCRELARERRKASPPTSEDYRRWNANRDREHVRRYNREYQTAARRAAGVPPRGAWRRHREGAPPLLPVGPLRAWLLSLGPERRLAVRNAARVAPRTLDRVLTESKRITLDLADRLVLAADQPDLLRELYP